MSYASVSYVGDGSTRAFFIPFPYINKADVLATVNGVTTAFNWITSSNVEMTTAPASGTAVVFKRVTQFAVADVVYQDGSTMSSADLNTSNKQNLYVIQESADLAASVLQTTQATALLAAQAGGVKMYNT